MPLAGWFGEESFTYIKVFGSIVASHVLPYYVPDKLLARGIAYQIVGEGITKTLKDMKKSIWPIFPVKCGSFSLFDFGHIV